MSEQTFAGYNLRPDRFDDLPIDPPMEAIHSEAVEHDPFAGEALSAAIPVTASQREVWIAAQLGDDSNLAYNEGLCITLRGALDEAALRHALQTVLDRHESLRARFAPDGSALFIRSQLPLALDMRDLRGGDALAGLAALEQEVMGRVFRLDGETLIRFTLARTADDEHHLLLVAHHLVCDGWSGAILIMEIGATYSARVDNRVRPLPPAPRSGDYALIERRFHGSETGRAHEQYWLDRLRDAPEPPALPHDLPRPRQRSFAAGRIDVPLAPDLISRLRTVGSANGASLVATTLAGFAALLNRLTGEQDLVIGLAAAGQAFHQQRHLVSHCVNLLPLRVRLDAAAPFTDTLKRTRDAVMDAFDHQGVTFGDLLPKLDLQRDPQQPPLVSVMFNIDMRDDDITHSGLAVSYRTLVRQSETFELFINLVDDGKSLLMEASYNADLFSRAQIASTLESLTALLEAVTAAPQTAVSALPLGSNLAARWQAFNATAAPIPQGGIAALIAAQAARTPDATALIAGGVPLSYAALLARAGAIAQALQAEGVGAGQTVGVCLKRTADLPASLLAVLATGAAYLPLDPEFPAGRIAYMLQDAGARRVISDGSFTQSTQGVSLLALDGVQGNAAFSPQPLGDGDAAFVIYTSGSTGQPKGVVVPHGGVVNVLTDIAGRLGVTGAMQLGVTTASFDIAACDFFMPLFTGGTLLLADADTARDGAALLKLLQAQPVRLLQCTPSTWRLLLAAGWPGSGDLTAVSTGEPLPREVAAELLPKVAALWNLYGPTETTIWSTAHRITDAAAPLLIGKPIANTQCHVLDAAMNPLPPGLTGRLWIGGAGLATGYHARPELTAERFVAHPTLGRLYDTGDLARLTPDGLECLGRADFQLKLRGYRIEPGEIEFALTRHPGVAEAAVMARERSEGDTRLIAWVALKAGSEATPSELRAAAREFLPAYMLPQEFVTLPALPRLPNGKLDRKALPDPFAASQRAALREPPQGAAETALAGLMAEVLGLKDAGAISREDRFFDLGGHSLLALKLAAKIEQSTGTRPGLRTLMMDPLTVIARGLSRVPPVTAAQPAPASSPARMPAEVLLTDLAAPVRERSPTQKRGWLGRLLGS